MCILEFLCRILDRSRVLMLLIFTVSCYCLLWLWFDACNQTVRFYPFCLSFSSAMFSMSWAVLGVFYKAQIARWARASIQRAAQCILPVFVWQPPFEGPWLRGGGGPKPTARTLACQKPLETIRAFFYLSFSLSLSQALYLYPEATTLPGINQHRTDLTFIFLCSPWSSRANVCVGYIWKNQCYNLKTLRIIWCELHFKI